MSAIQAIREVREDPSASGLRTVLYDADGSDREISIDDVSSPDLKDGQLLWVDVALDGANEVEQVASRLELDPSSIARMKGERSRPRLEQFDSYFHLNLHAVKESRDRFEAVEIHCLVGGNWVVTAHSKAFDLLGVFNEPIKGETDLGKLGGAQFLAHLLDWLLDGYFHVLEDLEAQVDDLDERLLGEDIDQDELLRDLVRLRRRITALRGMLAPHRDVATALTRPGFADESDPTQPYQRLYGRLEEAVDSLETAREMVVGSFEVFMTQTAQRTNDVMKILTVVSVLLLPAVVVAGIMGMNFRAPLFEDPDNFWVTIGAIVVMGAATLVIARLKRWI